MIMASGGCPMRMAGVSARDIVNMSGIADGVVVVDEVGVLKGIGGTPDLGSPNHAHCRSRAESSPGNLE